MFQLTKKQPDMRKEMGRRKSQSQRILELLKDSRKSGKPVYTRDLQRIAFKYSSRLDNLKKEGHRWIAEYVKPGVFRYTYKGQVNKD